MIQIKNYAQCNFHNDTFYHKIETEGSGSKDITFSVSKKRMLDLDCW
jgi:hypothetical protein